MGSQDAGATVCLNSNDVDYALDTDETDLYECYIAIEVD